MNSPHPAQAVTHYRGPDIPTVQRVRGCRRRRQRAASGSGSSSPGAATAPAGALSRSISACIRSSCVVDLVHAIAADDDVEGRAAVELVGPQVLLRPAGVRPAGPATARKMRASTAMASTANNQVTTPFHHGMPPQATSDLLHTPNPAGTVRQRGWCTVEERRSTTPPTKETHMSRTRTITLTLGSIAAGAVLATGVTGLAMAADSTPSPSSSATTPGATNGQAVPDALGAAHDGMRGGPSDAGHGGRGHDGGMRGGLVAWRRRPPRRDRRQGCPRHHLDDPHDPRQRDRCERDVDQRQGRGRLHGDLRRHGRHRGPHRGPDASR